MLLDPRNGPAFDLPPCDGPVRTYVIASVPRSGSTLLARLLWETGRVGAPKEYLNPMQVRDWEARLGPTAAVRWRHRALRGRLAGVAGRGPWTDARLAAYLDRVRARRTGPEGWFGLKLHHHHHQRWFVDAGRDLEAVLGPVRWVRITRDDTVAQAVSWTRALQTGRWASWQRDGLPAVYDRRAIAGRLAAIEAAEAAWSERLADRPVCAVTYEQLVADREATVRRVLRWLDVPDADTVAVPAPPVARQADATSAAWIARYRSGR